MGGQDNNFAAKILRAQTSDQLDPGHARHFMIDDDNVESPGLFSYFGKRLIGIKGKGEFSRGRTQREGQGVRHAKLVVYRKNVQGRCHGRAF
jgi:hypothetical protein